MQAGEIDLQLCCSMPTIYSTRRRGCFLLALPGLYECIYSEQEDYFFPCMPDFHQFDYRPTLEALGEFVRVSPSQWYRFQGPRGPMVVLMVLLFVGISLFIWSILCACVL